MINKPVGIITSLGRTGTLFFSELLKDIVTDAAVFHEVGYLNFGQYQGTVEKLKQISRQINEIGFGNIVLRKIFRMWGLLRMSNKNFLDQLDHDLATEHVIRYRKKFIENTEGSFYLEASSEYYGILDLFPDVFDQYKVVYIIRDGRDWVTSKMNFGEGGYSRTWFHRVISPIFPTAAQMRTDQYYPEWNSFDSFQKLCWTWSRLNKFAFKVSKRVPNIRIFRFEDLFYGQDRVDHLTEMVTYLVPSNNIIRGRMPDWTNQKIHKSSGEFPAWENWTDFQQEQFDNICGPLMRKFDYGYQN